MPKFGNERMGFEVGPHRVPRILALTLWGLWDHETNQLCRVHLIEVARAMNCDDWSLLLFLEGFPPQKPEFHEFIQQMMIQTKALGKMRAAHVMGSALSEKQLTRLAEASPHEMVFVQDEVSALRWIARNAAGHKATG